MYRKGAQKQVSLYCVCLSYRKAPLKIYAKAKSLFLKNRLFIGGDKRDRTADLLNAIQALSPYKRLANPKEGMESAFGTQEHHLVIPIGTHE